jgi:hypothetical protein
MRILRRLLRILRVTVIGLISLILLAFAFVQGEQYLLRYRATHLLDDFHSLRLKQSTWQDAQRLISRWGAFGHYDGTCNAAECSYFITLDDEGTKINRALGDYSDAHNPNHYSGITFGRILRLLGGRAASMQMGFLVRNNVVERSRMEVDLDVPGDDFWCESNCGYELILRAQAKDHLQPHEGDWSLEGDEEQLAKHPDFKAGQPSGCEICLAAWVNFTPQIDPQELTRITSYNMSCFAGFHVCKTLEEVLPAAADWQLYRPENSGPSDYDLAVQQPCKVPVFALARDSLSVLLVEALTVETLPAQPGPEYPEKHARQLATARILRTFKGSITPKVDLIEIRPFPGEYDAPDFRAENLERGKRYILLLNGSPGPKLWHCGVIEDSPQVEGEVERGLALNDNIHVKESYGYPPW